VGSRNVGIRSLGAFLARRPNDIISIDAVTYTGTVCDTDKRVEEGGIMMRFEVPRQTQARKRGGSPVGTRLL
jgi:hypothetical protein